MRPVIRAKGETAKKQEGYQFNGDGSDLPQKFAKRTYCEHGTNGVQYFHHSQYRPTFVHSANPRHKEQRPCPPTPCVSSKDPPWTRVRPSPPRCPRSSASS